MTSNSASLEPPHPTNQLPSLINGELDLDTLRSVTRHVRGCPACQAELLEVAVALGALRGVEREGLADLPDEPPLVVHPLQVAPVTSARPRRIRLALASAAAVVVLFAGGLVTDRLVTRSRPPEVAASAELKPAGAVAATGKVEMSGEGDGQTMTVTTSSLPPTPAGTFYEVWLLQPDTGQMLAVGVLPDTGTAAYALPVSLAGRYQAVDISLQPDNGVTQHSGNSILRAVYA